MSRFFEKSKSIETLTTKEIDRFLHEQNLIGKVTPERVKDFYNAASSILAKEDIKLSNIDYEKFDCRDKDDRRKIDEVRDREKSFLSKVNSSNLNSARLLMAACALAHKFEIGDDPEGEGINEYLKHLFKHIEDNESEGIDCKFKDTLDVDVKFMKYLALLSTKKAFSKTGTKMVRDHSGKLIKHSQMESYEQIFNMDLIDSAHPLFALKLAGKDLYIKSRFSKYNMAQNLVILVDNSGSMSDYYKMAMLKAALTLKIRDCSDINNVYIGTFEKNVDGFVKIEKTTKFEDLKFITLSRGTTHINECIKDTISRIKSRKLHKIGGGELLLTDDHFEILVINDGTDRVDPTYHPDIKIHALCLMQSNPQLKNICHRSSGTYHYLTED